MRFRWSKPSHARAWTAFTRHALVAAPVSMIIVLGVALLALVSAPRQAHAAGNAAQCNCGGPTITVTYSGTMSMSDVETELPPETPGTISRPRT